MIDIASETVIPLGDVPDYIPSRRPGKRLHVATVWRWVLHGVRGRKLETITIGGSRYTSVEALQRFVEAEPADPEADRPRPQRTEAQRRRDSERAAQALERSGA